MAELTLQELDRRLAHLEGWREGQEGVLLGFRDDLQELKQAVALTNQRIETLRQETNQRIDALHQKVDLQFRWLVGIQLTVLVVLVVALLRLVVSGG